MCLTTFLCVSGAVNIKIARVYSAEWPVGVVVPIFDAWYQSAQFYAKRDLLSKGRGCGGSILSIGGPTKNPVSADVRTLVDNGADVFAHSHGVSGGSVTGLSGSATSDQVNKWFVEHVTALRQLGMSGGSLWNLFYQNLGQHASGTDMAGILKNLGINASRGDCPDAEFGVNPATTAYMSLGSTQRETWARRRGRFNTRPVAAYTNMVDNNADYDGPPANASYPTLMSRVAFSALAKTPTVTYFHEILDVPTAVDNTPRFYSTTVINFSNAYGTGGMADVFRARDLLLERSVAIKILHETYSDDQSFQDRFKKEARAAANLSHPNIVTVHDFGFDHGQLFIVMEHIPGKDLKTILRQRGRYSVEEAIPLMVQACAGIGYAHRAGLVHCDIKPHNMIVTPDGRLKVTDFGIARALSTILPDERADVVWGSPQYFSPEQA